MNVFAAAILSLFLAASASAQTITIARRGTQPSRQGPAENFTGSVRVDPLFQASDPARAAGALVTFEAGARSAWHIETITHLAFYAGWPSAITAVTVAKDVFEKK